MSLLQYETKDGVAIISFVEKVCTVTPDFVQQLGSALDRAEADDEVLAVVTVGALDSHVYCSGFNLDYLIGGKLEDPVSGLALPFMRLIYRIMTFPLPTVAAVSGHAVAGGAFMALCHDMIVFRSDNHSFLNLPEVNLRLPFGSFFNSLCLTRLPRAILPEALLGVRFNAERLLQSGTVVASASGRMEVLSAAVARAKAVGVAVRKGPGGADLARTSLHTIKYDNTASVRAALLESEESTSLSPQKGKL